MNLNDLIKSPTELPPDTFLDIVLERRKARHTYVERIKPTNTKKRKPPKVDYSKWPIEKQLELLVELNKTTNHEKT